MDKHRPVWARGLTATELDRRQEIARVMNHGQQVLLESKLGKLSLREKRSFKDIRRQKEDMLLSLNSIKMASPRLSTVEKSHKDATTRPPRRQSGDTSSTATSSKENSSTSEGTSPENEDGQSNLPSPARSTSLDFHLPRLHSQPRAPAGHNSRRRYSANDALAQSIERFNAYKATLVRSPSSEVIDDGANLTSRPISSRAAKAPQKYTPTPVWGSIHRSHSWHDGADRLPRPPVNGSRRSLDVNKGDDVENDDPDSDIDTVILANDKADSRPSTNSLLPRKSHFLHPDAGLVSRSAQSGKWRPTSIHVDNHEAADHASDIEEVSIAVPVAQNTDRRLSMLSRRKSLAPRPATPRYLSNRRQSSPDVLLHTLSHRNRILLMSREQMPSQGNSPSPWRQRSDELDLNLKVKDFLERTDSFVKSSSGDNLKVQTDESNQENDQE